jgi:hypothetical protein
MYAGQGLHSDVVYLGALVYERKCGGRGGVAGSQPISTLQLYTGAPINSGDQSPYVTYRRVH